MLEMVKVKKITVLIFFLFLTLFPFLAPSPISAVWTKYVANPILEPGASGSWDDQGVFAPSIIFKDSIYKMWYAGYGGSPAVGRIGYATSPDGLIWTKGPGPVLSPSDPWEQHLGEPNVIFDEDEGIYKMWFTATGSGPDTYRIGYATSTNGTDWSRYPGFVLVGTSGTWDSGGAAAPAIMKLSDSYRMWYGGYSGEWQIGLANSSDGTSWVKFISNPVITPVTSWEQSAAAHPSLILESGVYKMWYHVGSGVPQSIAYATSNNGESWLKPEEQNPALEHNTQPIDTTYIATPHVIKQENIYKMWYSGYDGSHWRLGYASTEETIPTTTPMPTSTPTLTPTPTPTSGPRKVVFLPGLGSSWNADAILNCKTENYAGGWTLAPFAAGAYTPLLSALGENGKPFYYDWRKDVRFQAPILQNFINSLVGEGEKVNLVGHSLGGLVGRAYLENRGVDSKLEKLLTVGSPHQGAPQAYPGWSAGEIWEENLINKIAATILLKRCAARREEPRETLRRIAPSIQNLLPTFDYLRDNKTKILKPISKMNAQNNWLPTGFPFYDVLVGTLSGNGFSTLNAIKVKERSAQDRRTGNWADGKPAGKENTNEGDGAALLLSTQLPEAENRVINKNHGGLVSSNEGIGEILDFLGIEGAEMTTLESTVSEPQSALVIIGYPSGFWVMDSTGKLTKDQEGIISINNPGRGHYRFGLVPKSDKTLFIVAQFLEDGRTLWKEYNFKNRLPKFGKINFDPGNPQEDALRLGL